jgi:hypothetical protein
MDKFKVSVAIWSMAMKNEALYAMSIVPTTTEWIIKIEAIQIKVLKWITGASRRGSASGLRGEFGWRTMRAEVALRKMNWLKRITAMDKTRLPSIALKVMSANQKGHKWIKEVHRIVKEYGFNPRDVVGKTSKKTIYAKIEGKLWSDWSNSTAKNSCLKHYIVHRDQVLFVPDGACLATHSALVFE